MTIISRPPSIETANLHTHLQQWATEFSDFTVRAAFVADPSLSIKHAAISKLDCAQSVSMLPVILRMCAVVHSGARLVFVKDFKSKNKVNAQPLKLLDPNALQTLSCS